MTQVFYDGLAPFYHLLYPDWNASVERQGRGLNKVLEKCGVLAGARILDAACGIGTQSLGLAALGYDVTASDIAPATVARARREAASRGLHMNFDIADLSHLSRTFPRAFAAVLACDNAVPHLLTDDSIRQAFVECRKCLVPGGVLLVSVRDYAAIERKTPDVRPYGVHVKDGHRFAAEQVWEWDGDQYDLTLRLSDDGPDGERRVEEFRTRYYAIELPKLVALMIEAGFVNVARHDEHFFQPLLVAASV